MRDAATASRMFRSADDVCTRWGERLATWMGDTAAEAWYREAPKRKAGSQAVQGEAPA